MINSEDKVFLVCGANEDQRANLLLGLKRKILGTKNISLIVDYVYAKEARLEDLKDKLLTVSFEKQRLVIFKDILKLSGDLRDFLVKEFNTIVKYNWLIFEVNIDLFNLKREKKFNDVFGVFLRKQATIINADSRSSEPSVRDLLLQLKRKDLAAALYILERLYQAQVKNGDLGLLLLGVLNKEFSSVIDISDRRKLLNHLFQADQEIKEKGIESKVVLEKLLAQVANI